LRVERDDLTGEPCPGPYPADPTYPAHPVKIPPPAPPTPTPAPRSSGAFFGCGAGAARRWGPRHPFHPRRRPVGPELAPLVPHHLKTSDGRQVFFQACAFDRLVSAQQVPVVREQRIPDAGRNFLDQSRVPSSLAQCKPNLPDQVPLAFRVNLGPGFAIPGSAAIDQSLVGIEVRGLIGRDFDGMDGHERHRMSVAVTVAVSIAVPVAMAIAIAMAVQRLGGVSSNGSRAWHCGLAVLTVWRSGDDRVGRPDVGGLRRSRRARTPTDGWFPSRTLRPFRVRVRPA
jgi:hypothetical protein